MERESVNINRRSLFKYATAGVAGVLLSGLPEKVFIPNRKNLYAEQVSSPALLPVNRGPSVLDDPVIPILGWPGPSGEMLRDDVMKGMADAGFNLSLSSARSENLIQALDIAYRNGIRLVLQHRAYHVGDDYVLTEERKQEIRNIVMQVKDHPGLYAYHLRDEPRFRLLDRIGEVADFIRSLDSYHICYMNMNPPIQQDGLGASSIELFYKGFIEKVHPSILSYDHYSIQIGSDEEIEALGPNAPNVFGKVVVKPDYFEALDIVRWFSTLYGIPMWAFTCSVRHGAYPIPTEGYMRFQLMCNLAYGARGLEYFTYAYAEAMVRADGSTTPQWEMARAINRDIHHLWKIMKDLRSIAVYHTGPVWYGTRMLHTSTQPGTLNVKGDPAVIGIFDDKEGTKYAFLVNRNPVEWGRFQVEFNIPEGKQLVYWETQDDKWYTRWPRRVKDMPIALAPGEALLFKLGGEGGGRF